MNRQVETNDALDRELKKLRATIDKMGPFQDASAWADVLHSGVDAVESAARLMRASVPSVEGSPDP